MDDRLAATDAVVYARQPGEQDAAARRQRQQWGVSRLAHQQPSDHNTAACMLQGCDGGLWCQCRAIAQASPTTTPVLVTQGLLLRRLSVLQRMLGCLQVAQGREKLTSSKRSLTRCDGLQGRQDITQSRGRLIFSHFVQGQGQGVKGVWTCVFSIQVELMWGSTSLPCFCHL